MIKDCIAAQRQIFGDEMERVELSCMVVFGRLNRVAFCVGMSLLWLLPVFATAQATIQDGQPELTEHFLRKHHVSITSQALIAALQDSDTMVRKVAADVLSSRWPKEARSPLEAAMLRETDATTRIVMALDLATIGDKAGHEMLITECHDNSEWASTRMVAARSMFELHDNSCLDSVLDTLRSNSDPQDTIAKIFALYLVPNIARESEDLEYRNILHWTINALNDPNAGVRLTASSTLASLRDTSAIDALQAATASEQDPNIRSAMRGYWKRLKKLEQTGK
jgi:hypothetical protein